MKSHTHTHLHTHTRAHEHAHTTHTHTHTRTCNVQVIIERMDRLKPGVHLTLKVASVMGQWVDLDILHRFYPINKSKDELGGHLVRCLRLN